MRQFTYSGADASTGADAKGTIEADTEREAADRLREQDIMPATIKPAWSSAPGPTQPPAPGAPLPPDMSTAGGRASSTWATGIGGVLAGVLGVVALASIGSGQWACAAVGLVFLGLAFLSLLHVVIVDAMQPKAARNMQAQQCQQLATIIEQNRQLIDAMDRAQQ